MNASDKQLLQLAAKAAGYVIVGEVDAMVVQPGESKAGGLVIRNDRGGDSLWNPLLDDGDALRLAVIMKFDLITDTARNQSYAGAKNRFVSAYVYHDHEKDNYAATRKAIVLAAVEIGKKI